LAVPRIVVCGSKVIRTKVTRRVAKLAAAATEKASVRSRATCQPVRTAIQVKCT
jgi:hypothetical protein